MKKSRVDKIELFENYPIPKAVEIPAMFILNKIYPMYGLAFAMPVAEFVLCFIALIILKKILNNE